jgi:uncharacterized protein (TIGR02453 family)
MKAGFAGFPPKMLQFFRSLARNNRREWFQPRKETFEQVVKQPMLELVTAVNTDLRKFAPEYVTEPAKAVYRIYRDTRFSKDKTPYKTHQAASFYRRAGERETGGGFYLAVSHKESAIGGGLYSPEPAALLAIRNHIAEHHQELRKILKSKSIRELMGDLHGEQLSRVPKGFPADHPAADLLRYKRFILYVTLPPDLATTEQFYPEVLKRFRAMQPFLKFLSAPLEPRRRILDIDDLR